MDSGIYRIAIASYKYIGQSISLKERKLHHLAALKGNRHDNTFMQRLYNKYQEVSFEVLLYCGVEKLDIVEQHLIDNLYNTKHCINIAKDVRSPMRGKRWSKEAKIKQSIALKGNKNCLGKRNHFDHIVYNWINNNGSTETCTQYELRMKYNINSGNISKVVKNKRKSCKGWRVASLRN